MGTSALPDTYMCGLRAYISGKERVLKLHAITNMHVTL